jgi:pyruvate/2-oxoglutarate dehydrogenase complex dihydrolipoamide dehydrogenase (E3) component
MSQRYDAIVIGAGPAGEVAASGCRSSACARR